MMMFKVSAIGLALALCFQAYAAQSSKVEEGDFTLPTYQFQNGQHLDNLKIHYHTLGTPQKNDKGEINNAVLLLHATFSSGQLFLSDSFMSTFFAPGKPFDLNKYFIILPDCIGCGKSSKPSDGLRMKFPDYGYQDMVDLQYKLLTEHLGIKHIKMVLGTSMGGMHTWLWTVLHPDFMDGAMPVVSLPTAVTGRNILWREAFVQAIKTNPEWQNGNYKTQPSAVAGVWPFFEMMLNGVPNLQKELTTPSKALQFISEASEKGATHDANDMIYVLKACTDYNPEPNLDKIQAKVFALNFTDDAINPVELDILPALIKRVKNGRAVIQQGGPDTFGHGTLAHPELWVHQLEAFISTLPF